MWKTHRLGFLEAKKSKLEETDTAVVDSLLPWRIGAAAGAVGSAPRLLEPRKPRDLRFIARRRFSGWSQPACSAVLRHLLTHGHANEGGQQRATAATAESAYLFRLISKVQEAITGASSDV